MSILNQDIKETNTISSRDYGGILDFHAAAERLKKVVNRTPLVFNAESFEKISM